MDEEQNKESEEGERRNPWLEDQGRTVTWRERGFDESVHASNSAVTAGLGPDGDQSQVRFPGRHR